MKNQWRGTLIFLGQPAEEIVKGARAMLADPEFKRLPKFSKAFALHTIALIPKGKVAVVKGYALANSDSVDVNFKGRGAHGSAPHKSIDPIILGTEFVTAVQTIISRERDPQKPGVITVGSFHSGTKHNIISDEAKLQLTVRSYDEETRSLLLRRIGELAKGIAKNHGAPEPEIGFPESVDATLNDVQLADHMTDVFKRELGESKVVPFQPILGAEDFGAFGKDLNIPTLLFWVGQQNEKDATIGNHSPYYAPDFKATAPVAIKAMTAALMDVHSNQIKLSKFE